MGVRMSTAVLLALFLACAILAGAVLIRMSAARAHDSRQERLKAHLNWVNPEAPGARRRRSLLR